jgi:hypothetical protein
VRLEERELFPLIEQAIPAPELTTLAEKLQRAEADNPNPGPPAHP